MHRHNNACRQWLVRSPARSLARHWPTPNFLSVIHRRRSISSLSVAALRLISESIYLHRAADTGVTAAIIKSAVCIVALSITSIDDCGLISPVSAAPIALARGCRNRDGYAYDDRRPLARACTSSNSRACSEAAIHANARLIMRGMSLSQIISP